MQPFELPDFYVPWPARINPNLETARTYSKAWADEMGILNASSKEGTPNIWNEQTFDKHDYALFCAYVHPETSSSELNLMTAWNVWAFYVDDYFLQVYKRPKDHAGAKKYLDRVLLFMPIDINTPQPTPTNPMENGLTDLWTRTASTKSKAWRIRIAESMKNLLEAFLWELDSMNQQRLANPIEYIEMRRQVGAALWSADLVEHAMFVEIPERIANTRPIRVLKNTFADAVHLRNDIFSYQREVIKEGELTNAVLVIERFLEISTQKAANIVNDLLTSRLQQFEHTVLTELAQIFQDHGLEPSEQINVLTYIRGLQDWQSGAHEWHIQTSRYLNPNTKKASTSAYFNLTGLGTSVARVTPDTLGLNRLKNYIHTPYQKVGPTRLPEFYMPYKARLNPYVNTARLHSKTWAQKMGMLDSLPGYPNSFIWNEHKFDVNELVLFNALSIPDATEAKLNLDACWMAWGTYTDDYYAQVYSRTHNMAGAKAFYARLLEFMPIDDSTPPISVPLTPSERGLADVWARTAELLSIDERRVYRKVIEDMIGGWLWELSNRIQNRIPDLLDYIEMRHKTSGSDFILASSVKGQEVPLEVYRTLTIQELNNAAIDYVWLTNDIFSYQMEVEFEGDMHNGVLIIQNFLGCDRSQAVEIANNLMTARVKQFEHIVTIELPVLFENFGLNINAQNEILNYVEERKHFMSGSLHWHAITGRYKEIELHHSTMSFTGQPTGLGISAALLAQNSKNDLGDLRIEQFTPPEKMQEAILETSKTIKTFGVSHLEPSFMKKKEEAQLD